MSRKLLKSKAKSLEPILRIGKNGLSESMVKEINSILRQRKLIKIKLLKGAVEGKDKKELAGEIAEKTGSEIIEAVGSVVVVYKG